MLITDADFTNGVLTVWGDPPPDHLPWYPTRRVVLQSKHIAGYIIGAPRSANLRDNPVPTVNITVLMSAQSNHPINLAIICSEQEEPMRWVPRNTDLISLIIHALNQAVQ